MKSIGIKVVLVSMVLVGGMFTLAGTANASHVKAEITAPDEVTVGHTAEVQATLISADDGLPVADALVIFYMHASFADVTGEVELGRAVTDENGVATLAYEPRSASEHLIRIEYLAPGDDEPGVVTKSISVTGGTSQLHRSTAGVEIPGLNVWLIIALVSGVWAILFSVALRVIAIARAGAEVGVAPQPATVRPAQAQEAAPRSGGAGAR